MSVLIIERPMPHATDEPPIVSGGVPIDGEPINRSLIAFLIAVQQVDVQRSMAGEGIREGRVGTRARRQKYAAPNLKNSARRITPLALVVIERQTLRLTRKGCDVCAVA